MRTILFALLILFYANVKASTYYLSNNSGDDSRSAVEAQNPSTPWRTISKLNSVINSFSPGDAVLFKKGETFYGALEIFNSREKYSFGTSNSTNPLTFGAFGNGAKPIITGLQNITNWVSIGGGIYETALNQDNVNVVLFQGQLQAIGRWPKITAPGNGYIPYQSHVGTSSVSSNAISAAPNFVGGEVVIRKMGWIIDRGRVTTQTNSTIYYDPLISPGHPIMTYKPNDNFALFFQNHINALTVLGDWMYDPSLKKLRMYFGSNNPSQYTVQVPTIEKLINITSSSYITIDGLSLVGSNSNAVSMDYAYNIDLANTDINFTGIDAIATGHYTISSDITVEHCNITNTNNNSITANGTANWVIQNNVINNTGMIRGMGQSGDGQYNAISIPGDNSLIAFNEIKNTGYNPIDFRGDGTVVKNNFIDSFCVVKSDGGGIYTSAKNGKKGRKILGNIVLDGIGDRTGRPQSEMDDFRSGNVHGIYLDGGSTNVEVSDNTVANCSSSGLELSSSVNVDVENNTFFNNTYRQIYYWESSGPISKLTLKNNILFALQRNQLVALIDGSGFNTPNWGVLDNNYYCRPISEPNGIDVVGYSQFGTLDDYTDGGIIEAQNRRFYSLDRWQALSSQDAHTTKSPISITDVNRVRFEYNGANNSKTISLNAAYIDVRGVIYIGSVTLAPYTSVILIKTDAAVLNNQTITFNGLSNKNVGDATFNLTATASSGLPVSFRIVSGPATLVNNTVTLTDTGTVVVVASQSGNSSYNPATPITQSFSVFNPFKQSQAISFSSLPSKTFGYVPFALSATATSGLPVYFRIISGPATLSSNIITLTATGTVVVEAFQVGSADYDPATPVTQSFNVVSNQSCKTTFMNGGQIVASANCGLNDGALYIVPTSGTPPFLYSKDGGTTYVSGPNDLYAFINLAVGTYQLRLKDANGCVSDVVEKTVNSLNCPNESTCTPPLFKNNGEIVADATCNNNDGALYIVPISGTPPFMYSKDGGETYVAGPNDLFSFQNLSAGTYSLRLRDAKGCESEIVEKKIKIAYGLPCFASTARTAAGPATDSLHSVPMDVPELSLEKNGIKAYPNPSQGQFKVHLLNFELGITEAYVIDSRGSVIKKNSKIITSSDNTIEFNLSSQSVGLYYIKIVNKKETKTSKIIIQR